jgi:hypothetical protein
MLFLGFWSDFLRGFPLFLHARFLASSLWLSIDAKRATPLAYTLFGAS